MVNDQSADATYETDEDDPDTVAEAEREYDEYGHGLEGEDSDWTDWLDEGTIALLLIVGGFLFFVPEPFTSVVGVLLIAAGLGGLLVDALS